MVSDPIVEFDFMFCKYNVVRYNCYMMYQYIAFVWWA